MNDRRALGIAALAGLLAIGGLALYARHQNSPAPRVLGQTVLEAKGFRGAVLRIEFRPSPGVASLLEEGETWEYRVAEPGGRVFALEVNCDENTREIRVPYAYVRPPVSPRLEVRHEGRLLGWTDLDPLPPPRVERLAVEPRAPLRAFRLSPPEQAKLVEYDGERMGGIRLAPRVRLPADEYWTLELLRTPTESSFYRATAGVHPGRQADDGTDVVRVHYADEIDAVRVSVVRWKHRRRSETVRITGLHLVKRGGQTTLAWDGKEVRTSLGISLRRLPSDQGYSPEFDLKTNKVLPGDALSPSLGLWGGRTESSLFAPAMDRGATGTRAWNRFSGRVSYEFVDPRFDRLGIRRIFVGGASWRAKGPVARTVDPRPFDATLRINEEWNEKVGEFEATIPVESAPGSRL